MIEAILVGGEDESILPKIFRQMPEFCGPIGELPIALRHRHMLHVTILKPAPLEDFAHHLRDIAKALEHRVNVVSALGGEAFYSGWCLSFGTARMFEDAGTILLEEDKTTKLDVPEIVGQDWGFRGKKLPRGARRYSVAETEIQSNLGALLYRLERILVGALKGRVFGDPSHQVRSMIEPYLQRYKLTARGGASRGEDGDYAYRYLRNELGAKRLKILHGAASLREIGVQFEAEGAGLAVPRYQTGWERQIPSVLAAFETLDHLLVLCQRAQRMQNIVDRNIGLDGLDWSDDPVLLLPEVAAEILLGFGSEADGDRMPDLSALTRVAFDFDCNAADLYPSLGPLRLHLAAACALGRRSRGVAGEQSDEELWGLRGLAGLHLDEHCFPELLEARQLLRRLHDCRGDGGENALPPSLEPREGIYNVPIVLKRSSAKNSRQQSPK